MRPNAEPLASHSFQGSVQSLAWHPGGGWLVIPSSTASVHWMDAETGEGEILGEHKFDATTAVFSPDGAYLFTGGWEEELICWNGRSKSREFTISLNSHTIQFNADGQRCALMSESAPKLRLYSFERPSAHREFAEDLGGRLSAAAFSVDGRMLAAAGAKRAGLWNLSNNGPGTLDQASDIHCFSFTADGRELFASGGRDGKANCFRWRIDPATNVLAAPKLTRLPLRKPAGFTHLTLTSNSVVMTGTKGSQVLPCGSIEGDASEEESHWTATMSGISGVSPKGSWLGIFQPYTTSLYIYQLPGLKRVAKLPHPTIFGDFQFSPTEGELVIASSRTGAEFWSTTNWQRTRTLTNASRIFYSPDGRTLWVTHDQRTAGLYDAQSLKPLLPLPTGMLPLAVSPDGGRLAVSVDGRRLQLWDLAELRDQFRKLGLAWEKENSNAGRSH
jgi:WD40 repeat protein